MGAFALASKSVRLLTILCLAVCLRPGSAAADSTLTTLYNFAGNDGAQPTGRLIFDKSGALYGTTDIGGAEGSPSYGDLVFDKSGALYGATLFGGTFNHGTVFKLTPPAKADGVWTETILHSFTGNDGVNPYDGLILDKSGALYGRPTKGVPTVTARYLSWRPA